MAQIFVSISAKMAQMNISIYTSDFAPQNPKDKTGVTVVVTPVSYPFETVIETSKQLLYGVRPEASLFSCSSFYLETMVGSIGTGMATSRV